MRNYENELHFDAPTVLLFDIDDIKRQKRITKCFADVISVKYAKVDKIRSPMEANATVRCANGRHTDLEVVRSIFSTSAIRNNINHPNYGPNRLCIFRYTEVLNVLVDGEKLVDAKHYDFCNAGILEDSISCVKEIRIVPNPTYEYLNDYYTKYEVNGFIKSGVYAEYAREWNIFPFWNYRHTYNEIVFNAPYNISIAARPLKSKAEFEPKYFRNAKSMVVYSDFRIGDMAGIRISYGNDRSIPLECPIPITLELSS